MFSPGVAAASRGSVPSVMRLQEFPATSSGAKLFAGSVYSGFAETAREEQKLELSTFLFLCSILYSFSF